MKRLGGIALATAVLIVASLAGCSSTPDEVTQYVKQASAAEQSAAVGGGCTARARRSDRRPRPCSRTP
ncbi:hypothetical protein [Pseudolysinimonas kribbensis]|uniref:hypothetical protein n=1 Tax=Pseudolysinimonas kribbensis TaxID=433641 RepID=UPI0024E167C4|nr:hypothetical protein [Pseudolysinimonas kribbensis]